MRFCNETVTLVQIDEKQGNPLFNCTAVNGASWQGHDGLKVGGRVLESERSYTVLIPREKLPDVEIQKGDIFVRGTVLGSIQRTVDLKPCEHFTVQSIAKNYSGRFPHMAVSGK